VERLVAIALFLLPFATPVAAQSAPAAPPKRDIVDARADLNFVNATGNSRTQTLGVSADVWLRPDGWAFRNRAGFVRSEARGAVTARQLTYLSRLERPAGRAFVFAQYDLLRDRLAGVGSRQSATVGVQWKALGDAKGIRTFQLFTGAGAAREHRVTAAGAHVAHIDTALVNAGWAYVRKFTNGSEFKDDIRTDVALDRRNDWRVSHTVVLSATVNSRLSLKLQHVLRYVNDPPPTYRRTDTVASAGVVVRF
jgi:putative salt-induced outer membrane protein YdiY